MQHRFSTTIYYLRNQSKKSFVFSIRYIKRNFKPKDFTYYPKTKLGRPGLQFRPINHSGFWSDFIFKQSLTDNKTNLCIYTPNRTNNMQVEIKYAKKCGLNFFFPPNCLALYVKYYQILFSRGGWHEDCRLLYFPSPCVLFGENRH